MENVLAFTDRDRDDTLDCNNTYYLTFLPVRLVVERQLYKNQADPCKHVN